MLKLSRIKQILLKPAKRTRHFLKSARRWLHGLSPQKQFAVLVGAPVISIGLIYGALFFPRKASFSYASQTCVSQLVLLPNLHKTADTTDYSVRPSDEVKLGSLPIASKSVCIEPLVSPDEGEHMVSMAPFGGFLFRKTFELNTPEQPKPDVSVLTKPIPTHEPLVVPMSAEDSLHAYTISFGDKQAPCQASGASLICDIPSMNLEQGKDYQLSLASQFRAEPAEVLAEQKIATLSATTITESSIAPGALVYEKPSSLVFKTDKTLKAASVKLIKVAGESREILGGKTSIESNQITFAVDAELPRLTDYEVVVEGVKAEDGSSLAAPYSFGFKTSGGPQVASVSIGKTGVVPGAAISVTFDQALAPGQNVAKLASISGADASITASGNRIIFTLRDTPKCTDFTLAIKGVATSVHGVDGSVAWSYGSRTRCHTISTIGYSVNGRAINAYHFGSGSETILYIAATHGNERSGGYLMDRWIQELEARAREIPANKRVIVVPRVSPDAFAANTRRNAHNVDLNRNFPTNDWKADVTMPGGQLVVSGGGSAPLSEPESKAIANFTTSLRPKLVLTYHAVASNVIANEAGISWSAASKYAALSRYSHVPKSQTGEVFQYDTTGAYEDWLYEKQGIAAILIEMSSMSSSQFERNQSAMWAMLSL